MEWDAWMCVQWGTVYPCSEAWRQMSSGVQSCVCEEDAGSAQAVEHPGREACAWAVSGPGELQMQGRRLCACRGAAEMDSLQKRECVSSGASGCAWDASMAV